MGEVIFCHALLDPIDFCFFPSLASSAIYSLLCHASVGKWYVICWVVGGFFFCCFLVRELGSPRAIAQVPKFLPFLGKLCCLGKLLVSNGMLTCGVKPSGCCLLDIEKSMSCPFALFTNCTIPHLLTEVWHVCHGVCKHAWNGDPQTAAGSWCFWSPCDFHSYTSA